jgi:hypothetical protein
MVGTALFVLTISVISYGELKTQFEEAALQANSDARDELLVPQLCGNARGLAGKDYTTELGSSPGPGDTNPKPNPFENCWYAISKFRALYPEFQDLNLSDKDLSKKLYADHGVPLREAPNPWVTLGTWASFAFGIPLLVLLLGASLAWAFAGFSTKRH